MFRPISAATNSLQPSAPVMTGSARVLVRGPRPGSYERSTQGIAPRSAPGLETGLQQPKALPDSTDSAMYDAMARQHPNWRQSQPASKKALLALHRNQTGALGSPNPGIREKFLHHLECMSAGSPMRKPAAALSLLRGTWSLVPLSAPRMFLDSHLGGLVPGLDLPAEHAVTTEITRTFDGKGHFTEDTHFELPELSLKGIVRRSATWVPVNNQEVTVQRGAVAIVPDQLDLPSWRAVFSQSDDQGTTQAPDEQSFGGTSRLHYFDGRLLIAQRPFSYEGPQASQAWLRSA